MRAGAIPDALLTEAERGFRDAVRDFAETALPADLRHKVEAGEELDKADYLRWQRLLAGRGWLVPAWPVAQGGTGWSVVQHYLFEEELALAGCPPVALTLGVGPKLVGPIICAHGTAEQQARWLPRIRDSLDWWCQGYSEPDAGSDLAALRTCAVREGGHYIVTGTKLWTSYAHWADLACVLVRTDPAAKPQAGISFLAVDLRSPGVTVRPIRTVNGRHFFNEIHLDAVRVPLANRIGAEHAGWGVAKALLEHERLGAARVAETKKTIALVARLATAHCRRGRPAIEDPAIRLRLRGLEVEALAVERTALRFVALARSGAPIGAEISMLKLRGTEIMQALMDLACDVIGSRAMALEAARPGAFAAAEGWQRAVGAIRLYYRGLTIAAGTSEVQRDILARRLLD
jgi:alkylation response protein AidB-like acyl-CoA dehydrogenase